MPEDTAPQEQHPRGTLALVGVLGVAFVVAYLLVFFLIYLPRGPLTR